MPVTAAGVAGGAAAAQEAVSVEQGAPANGGMVAPENAPTQAAPVSDDVNRVDGRQFPAENDVTEGIAVPSSNVPIQTPF